MLSDRLLRNCILLSVLLHLIFMVLASMIRWTPHRADNVMVVDLADMPRSTEFLRPQPGIVEGARPKPPPPPPPKPPRKEKPRLPPPREIVSRVPDLPVNPELPPEKEFPVPRPSDKAARAEEAKPSRAEEAKSARAEETKPAREASPPPRSAKLKSLSELTPSLGEMVMAKATPQAGRGEETSSGSAVGTGGKAVEKGAITEEGGGGTRLTALNAPEIQYISYFASIKRKIELVWQYPQDAANAGIQGELTVDFIIARDGSLESVHILQGSGYKILDDEAVGSIRIAAPYNPIPENYTIPNLRIRAHFIYQMHTLKIR